MDRLTTGNAELDRVLEGGLPRASLIVVAGAPGTGKTILAQQICFANATTGRKALYYTTLSEPHSKMIQHLGSFGFWDQDALGTRIEFLDFAGLGDGAGRFGLVADEIVRKSFESPPSVIVIDSAKALQESLPPDRFRAIVFDLASKVSHTEAVLIFVGEYAREDIMHAPEFAVADGIVYLEHESYERLDRRMLRVLKMRGSDYLSGSHRFRIAGKGVEVFPRPEATPRARVDVEGGRVPSGMSGLDEMMGGGIPVGNSTLVAGPSGAGKTVLALHFCAGGIRQGEGGLYLTFQENERQLLRKAAAFGWDLGEAASSGLLRVRHVPPVEVSPDIVAADLASDLHERPAQRVVVDGLNELEHGTRGGGRFPDYLWALVETFRAAGATSMFTSETTTFFGPSFELVHGLSFVFDNVVLLRYAEVESEIRRVIGIVKMRDSDHVRSLVEFEIGKAGARVSGKFAGLAGVLTGTPVRAEERFREFFGR